MAPTTTVSNASFSANTGAKTSDFVTNTATQTISGKLSDNLVTGEIVEVSLDAGASWEPAATAAGSSSWTLSAQLTASSTLQVRVSDAAGNKGTVWSQPYTLDTTAPSLQPAGGTPADNATNVAIGNRIVLTFSEALRKTDDQLLTVELKEVGSNNGVPAIISINDSGELVIDPIANLAYAKAYYVTWGQGALMDAAGNLAASVTDNTTFNFTTQAEPAPAPAPAPAASLTVGGVAVTPTTDALGFAHFGVPTGPAAAPATLLLATSASSAPFATITPPASFSPDVVAGTAPLTDIQSLYAAYFGRPADTAGLDFWSRMVAGSTDPLAIAALASMPEAALASQFDGLSPSQVVTSIYQYLFGRASSDMDGMAFWTAQLGQDLASAPVDARFAVFGVSGTPGAGSSTVVSGTPSSSSLVTAILAGAAPPSTGTARTLTDASPSAPSLFELHDIPSAFVLGQSIVVGGRGNNFVIADGDAQTIILGAGDDELHGGGGDDVIGSMGGDDRVYGDAGNDVVFGGAGNDTLSGGTGNDRLNGGLGWDTALQTGAQSDYQLTQDKGTVILTHKNGEVDRLTSVEVITFDTGKQLYVATSDAQAAFAHIVTTWLGRELTAQEGVLSQQWAGRTPEAVADALRTEHFSAALTGKTSEELIAGWQSNAQVLRVQVASEYIAADGVMDSATFADITAPSLRFSVGEGGRWEGIDLRTGAMVSIDAKGSANFSEAYYLASKLAQLRDAYPLDTRWQQDDATATAMIREAIAAIGLTPEQHFEQHGLLEQTSANPWFDASQYLNNKVQQLNRTQENGRSDWTAQQVVDAVAANNMTLWTHYQQWGWREDVLPSNQFDATQYFADKLEELHTMYPDQLWTMASMKDTFVAHQYSPIDHYVLYGHGEGIEITSVGVPGLTTSMVL